MEPTREASHTITRLKSRLTDIFVDNVDSLVHELELLFSINEKDLYVAEDPVEQVQQILDHVLQRGESDCQGFLCHLQNMVQSFPGLVEVLESEKKRNVLTDMIKQRHNSKFTLSDILNIGRENLNECGPWSVQDLPCILLRKLAALNRSARSVSCTQTPGTDVDNAMMDLFDLITCNTQNETCEMFNPLDILCVLLNSSDNILQQNIISKMAMCQFAVPLLLPASDEPKSTFMLWAMRDTVKCWKPHTMAGKKGFREDSLVHIQMPIISFVRLEKSKLSKSKILNQVLSPTQQYQDFFIHENMAGGNRMKHISNGLVEIAWYFPTGRKNLDIFEEPIAFTNLRGDIEGNKRQFCFLTQISAAVFVFAEEMNEREFKLLSQYGKSKAIAYFIITQGNTAFKETVNYLKRLFSELNINERNILIKGRNTNDTDLVEKIKTIIKYLPNTCRKINLEEAADTASKLQIHVDENIKECQKAKKFANEITKEIQDVVQYKKETMKLQGDLWKQVAQTEKELCRMRKQGDKNTEEYRSQLIDRCFELHRRQYQHELPVGIMKFINAIAHLSQEERKYFLKWMKFGLDLLSRNNLSKLKAEYRLKCTHIAENAKNNEHELKLLDQQISDSSLGLEHFLREMGQFYEAECSMLKKRNAKPNERQFSKLPAIAADLLLDGFPLELIDGDASNIPLRWITDVLADLNTKTGGKCRMRVITVLGVQSTGKSTLLNIMFGLQFPVASGRCTRGAFMTLLKVNENFQEQLGCELIVVIDTEGLKAKQLASLEDSYEHDNELATLVVGLSDITIINMSMENTAEMTDTLQISVHAFLRMNEIAKKPKCQFVHQNVSDVSANDNIMRDKRKLVEQLDNMTKVAATMEKKSGITYFSDIMDYNFEKDNWYIPGLWHGVPPMASVDTGYSDGVYELKKYLFELMAQNKSKTHPQNIGEFTEWIKCLWNSVKYENFIFSFRNTLVAEAYEQLSVKYSSWEWDFRKEVHTWLLNTETIIKNQLTDKLQTNYLHDLHTVLGVEEKRIKNLLDTYFDSRSENAHLIERYREEFSKCVLCLKNELEHSVTAKIGEVIRIQKGKYKLESIQRTYQKTIEEKVTSLLEDVKQNRYHLSNEEVRQVFEDMWGNILSELQRNCLDKRNVSPEMLQELYRDMSKRGSFITERILNVTDLEDFGICEFEVKESHLDLKWTSKEDEEQNIMMAKKMKYFASCVVEICSDYVKEKVETREDYHETYCLELLNIINERLLEEKDESIHITHEFDLDIKLHILGHAATKFQKLHDDFIQENNPVLCMKKLKPDYLATFESIYQEKDESQSRARQFCYLCLKPAITDYINQRLGWDIVDAILHSGDTKEFSSRTFFQFTVLEKLLEENNVMSFVQYINKYEIFVKKWIREYILKTYQSPKPLQDMEANILSRIHNEIITVLRGEDRLKCSTVPTFLECFCAMLNSKIVIPQHKMNLIIFQNKANIQQFAKDIESFLQDIVQNIILESDSSSIGSILGKVTVKPENELFKRVFGCGKQCPFCKVPCEAGGSHHKEHFATVHRPQGLIGGIHIAGTKLNTEICSSAVISDKKFINVDTKLKLHPYKEYCSVYPDWAIQPDPSITVSDYWKYIFVKFNKKFAVIYGANPADLPDLWCRITKEMAFQSLKESFIKDKDCREESQKLLDKSMVLLK